MTIHNDHPRRARLPRRAALLLPGAAALSGCGIFDNWFGADKEPLPGKRIAVMTTRRGLSVDENTAKVVLPAPVANEAWPQVGGNPSHYMGHLAAGDRLSQAWRSGIGAGGGYRRKITAQPVVSGGRIFAMDSDAVVTGFDARTGSRIWRTDTEADDDRSTNVGGGIAVEGDTLYAATGRAELLAIDAATGSIKWRNSLPAPARAAPTIAEGRLFVPTLDDQLLGLAADDGRKLWSFQASTPQTTVLGVPSPAYADGLVVAGFGAGDLVALRPASGAVVWSDSLAAARGRNSLLDLSSITGLPVVSNGRAFAVSLGGLLLSLDVRSGRRLWEREIASGNTPWLAGDWLFVLSTESVLAAVTREEGRVAWLCELPKWQNEEKQRDPITWQGPALVGDRLIVASSTAQAMAVSPYTGEILGKQDLSGAISVAPVICDNTVFLVTDDASLLALR